MVLSIIFKYICGSNDSIQDMIYRSQREDEIENYYRQKFGNVTTAERYGDGEEMTDEITQQGRLPGVK